MQSTAVLLAKNSKSNSSRQNLGSEAFKIRSTGLDVLRFVAVLLVLHLHGSYVLGPIPWQSVSITVKELITVLAPHGERGVDIFFVLSGFLVAGLLMHECARTGNVDLRRFFFRRGFKIYPSFWLLVLVTAIQAYLKTGRVPIVSLVTELLFIQNYIPGLWEHTWSLAVEEHFYLILIGVFFLLKHCGGADTIGDIPKDL